MISRLFLSRSLACRHVRTMSATRRRAEPWVAIMGTTGTGKSDLAVDLACKFNGEIINADAMQMYSGLPVITNQISHADQHGVPHHLLASIPFDQPSWTVGLFAREATKLIREIRGRGKLPIVVGGTHYYISALLFQNTLVDSVDELPESADGDSTFAEQTAIEAEHPILCGPADLMLKRLQEVDPVIAQRWHPDDRRKIKRSLEIFLTTGKKASDIYAEQKAAKETSMPRDSNSPWQALMFWVYSEPEVLKDRLDQRVDKMEKSGLMHEVEILHHYIQQRAASGHTVDRTRGIWQSIGFKQLEPYLLANRHETPPTELQKLKTACIDDMKTATRQYARSQLRWLRMKTIPALQEAIATDYLYLLDSSNPTTFTADVLAPAAQILNTFLGAHDEPLPQPTSISQTASRVLSPLLLEAGSSAPTRVFEARTCQLCNVTLVTQSAWDNHMNSRRHRRLSKDRSRMALVAVEDVKEERLAARKKTTAANGDDDDNNNSSDIDLVGLP